MLTLSNTPSLDVVPFAMSEKKIVLVAEAAVKVNQKWLNSLEPDPMVLS
jgi:hypothetical protein